jgi:hypothetical protein
MALRGLVVDLTNVYNLVRRYGAVKLLEMQGTRRGKPAVELASNHITVHLPLVGFPHHPDVLSPLHPGADDPKPAVVEVTRHTGACSHSSWKDVIYRDTLASHSACSSLFGRPARVKMVNQIDQAKHSCVLQLRLLGLNRSCDQFL